jgi:hypothetical protein
MKLLIRWAITSFALYVAAWIVPGIRVEGNGWVAFGVMAIILGLVNAIVRPVLKLLSCPLIIVDGVLLKKRGSLCFSELMPRRYLLAVRTDTSGRIGRLEMGCRSIFAIDGDQLSPRQTTPEVVTSGMKERFGNSLASFSKAFRSPQ